MFFQWNHISVITALLLFTMDDFHFANVFKAPSEGKKVGLAVCQGQAPLSTARALRWCESEPTWGRRGRSHPDAGGSCGSSQSLREQKTSCHWGSRCRGPTAGRQPCCPRSGWEGSPGRPGACPSSTVGSTWSACSPARHRGQTQVSPPTAYFAEGVGRKRKHLPNLFSTVNSWCSWNDAAPELEGSVDPPVQTTRPNSLKSCYIVPQAGGRLDSCSRRSRGEVCEKRWLLSTVVYRKAQWSDSQSCPGSPEASTTSEFTRLILRS